MNIKKLFSVAAVVTFVGSTFLPGLAQAETPDTELGHAYEWAHSKGITTMDTYEKANMYGAITRAEMAKMLSVYATEILGKTADTSKACEFSDIASVGGDLKDFIVKSCQLSVMGQNITAFRPYDTITRAEFGTALSRVLWGDTYNNGTPYYANHLNALKEAGIMKQIANADSTKEIRGYVMIMLQRASEGEDKDLCEMCLATGIGADKCEAVCGDNNEEENTSDEKVKSGDLEVEATANNGKAILANGVSDMDTLTFKTSEEVEITKVVLERYGYSTSEDVAQVRLEDENGTTISNVVENLDSKGQAKLTIKKGYRDVDGVLNATVVVKTSEVSGSGNKTIGFKVIDVDSTAKNLNVDNYSPYTYTVVNYQGANVTLTARAATKTYNWEAGESYEVAKFKLKAPSDSAIEVRSFTLNDNESNAIEYDEFLEDVKVTVAGKEVKSSWSVNKDDELIINLKDVELAAKENAEFVVSIKLADDFNRMGNDLHFYISEAADISAIDTKTESRVLVKNQAGDAYAVTKTGKTVDGWYTCSFNGGKVKISSTKLGNIDASEDSTDIVIAEGEITTSQSIKVTKDTIVVTVTNNNNTDTNSKKHNIVKAMRLEIAGDEYEGTPVKDANKVVTSFKFPAIDVDHSGKIRILVDTDENALRDSYAIFGITGLKDFKYEDAKDKNNTADVAGSLNISRLTIAPSEADLTNSAANDEVEFKLNDNSEEVTIFQGKYTNTTKQRDVYLNEFKLEGTNWKDAHKMTVYLYIGGEAVADAELVYTGSKWVATDTFSNTLVKGGESVDVELTAQVEAKDKPEVSADKFTLYLRGEDENGNTPAGSADKKTAKVSVINLGTADIEVGKAKKTVLLRGAEDAIAEFTVKPNGGSKLDLESVSFLRPTGFDCTTLKLEGVNKDFKNGLAAGKAACVVDGFVKSIDKSGLTLRIILKDEPEATDVSNATNGLYVIAVEGLKINGKDANETFSKAYTDGIITFSQKGNKETKTTYTIEEIKGYNASTKISNIRFFDSEDPTAATAKEFITTLAGTETFVKGDDFDISNDCKGDQQILSMMYTVKVGNNDPFDVVVSHKDFPDYFKTTGGDKLRVYDNGKDSCTITNKKTPGSSAPTTSVALTALTSSDSLPSDVTVDGWLGASATVAQFQKDVKIEGTKITGTLCKQDPKVTNNNAPAEYVLILNATAGLKALGVKNLKTLSAATTGPEVITITIDDEALSLSYGVLRIVDGSDVETEYDISGLSLEECTTA